VPDIRTRIGSSSDKARRLAGSRPDLGPCWSAPRYRVQETILPVPAFCIALLLAVV
jgi:hypothetical protein